jgi:tetratricopeptide (TPR) repeat protein
MPTADAIPQAPPAQLAPSSIVTTRFGPHSLHGFDPEEDGQRRRRSLREMLPPQKIAWGVLLTLLIIPAPAGLPLLVVGLRQLRSPAWRIRILVSAAEGDGDDARILLESALAIDPDSPVVQRGMARWDDRHLHLAAAIRFYRQYLAQAPDDWRTRALFAAACLRHGLIDDAIAGFTAVLAEPGLGTQGRASASAHLAYALLCKERLAEAGSLLEKAPLGDAASLGPGEQQCAYYTAVVRYLRGDREPAIELIDGLCQLHPEYPELLWSALSMRSSTFHLLLPQSEALVPAPFPTSTALVRRVSASPLRCATCGAPREGNSARCQTCHSSFPD